MSKAIHHILPTFQPLNHIYTEIPKLYCLTCITVYYVNFKTFAIKNYTLLQERHLRTIKIMPRPSHKGYCIH